MSDYTLKIESPSRGGFFQYEATLYAPDGKRVGSHVFETRWFIRRWAKRRARWHEARSVQTIRV